MVFVFSVWYIIAAILFVGIIASLFIFFKMDKKDRILLDKFVEEQTKLAEQQEQKQEEVKSE
jgi:hypothetical protein